MNTNEPNRDRWVAFWLGELPEAEHAEVAAEMAKAPAEAERLRRTVAEVEAWAKHDPSTSRVEQVNLPSLPRRKSMAAFVEVAPRWSMAAAGLFMIAMILSQTNFELTFPGGTTLAWGRSTPQAPPQSSTEIAALRTELALLRSQLKATQTQTTQLASDLHTTASELAYQQQAESYTRYGDMQKLLEVALAKNERYGYAR